MKKCPDCGEIKPLTEFYKGNSYCKPCAKKLAKEWASDNRDRVREINRIYRQTDNAKQKIKERREKDIDHYRAKVNQWHKDHKEHFRKKDRLCTAEISDKYVKKQLRKSGILNPTIEQIEQRRKSIQEYRDKYTAKEERYFCKECSASVPNEVGKKLKVFCSPVCKKRHWQRIRNTRRRLKIREVMVDNIDPTKVFERDGYTCQICGRSTPIMFRGSYLPYAPEVDHIIPIKKKGEHSYKNVQCTCRACNQLKGSKIYAKPKRTQTRYREVLLELRPSN